MKFFYLFKGLFDPSSCHYPRWILLTFIFLISGDLFAQEPTLSPDVLKTMSLEELLDIEITSVSKQPEKLSESASAIQVVKSTDILRYGATNLPEALYLAGNLQVAQKGAHSWGISARGFNTDLANKLLVMIDGRSVYTPLFSGVFWERQDYLLEDLSQIEVISGPGGTIWGANAINGVINIKTKEAGQTQGLFAEVATGNELKQLIGLRYGGKLTEDVHYRVYGKFGNREGMVFEDSTRSGDPWKMGQGGFRMDAKPSSNQHFTLQGDFYSTKADITLNETSKTRGGNALGRWAITLSNGSSFQVQSFYDRTKLYLPAAAFIINGTELAPAGVFKDDLTTFDLELLYRFRPLGKNKIITGTGYRFSDDKVTNAPALGFLPERLKQSLYSVFIQDEINLLQNLFLTLGSKLEHNAFTGFVFEPSSRLRVNLGESRILWAAASRAVRMPSRIDRQITQGTPPYFVLLRGNPDFKTEKVIALESGFRTSISSIATASISLFFNQYDDIRSTVLDPVTTFPLYFENGLAGDTYGLEASMTLEPFDWWSVFSSYNYLHTDIRVKKGHTDFNNAYNETADPSWQYTLRSSFDLPFHLSISPAFRWVDNLTINNAGVPEKVPAYAELDGSISWEPWDAFQLSVAGRNLLHGSHVEYGLPGSRVAIQRSVYVKLAMRF